MRNRYLLQSLYRIICLLGLCLVAGQVQLFAQSERVDLVGRLEVQVLDLQPGSPGEWKAQYVHFLRTANQGSLEVEFPGGVHRGWEGRMVRVRGELRNGRLKADEVAPIPSQGQLPQALEDTTGEQATLVVFLNYPDDLSEPWTIAQAESWIMTAPDSVNNFLIENSFSQISLALDYVDWMVMPHVSSTYTNNRQMLADAVQVLDPLVDFQQVERLILFFGGGPNFGAAGIGTVGKWWFQSDDGDFLASASWIFSASPFVIAHEFGHNLGFWHASTVSCIPESLVDPTSPNLSCDANSWAEYGDRDAVMGASGYRHFPASDKVSATWIDGSQVLNVPTPGDHWLDQVELPSEGAKVLRIPLGLDDEGWPFYYWLEYRAGLGTFGGTEVGGGVVQVRMVRNTVIRSVLDTVDNSLNTVRFTGLARGGAVSGTITRDLDGAPIESGYVWLWDSGWNFQKVTPVKPGGHYQFVGLDSGGYYLRTSNGAGYTDEYFDDVTSSNLASLVNVSAGSELSGVNFGLAGTAAAPASDSLSSEPFDLLGNLPSRLQKSVWTAQPVGQPEGTEAVPPSGFPDEPFANIEVGTPFHDPYRGIRVELLELAGTGADSKARISVNFPAIRVSPDEPLIYEVTRVSEQSARTVTFTNVGGQARHLGTLELVGRHPASFGLGLDDCSNSSLPPSSSCSVEVVFSPLVAERQFATLAAPTDDELRPVATLSLLGWGDAALAGNILDVDGSGTADALTDGLLLLRYLFGFRGEALVGGVVGSSCSRCDSSSIEGYLAANFSSYDIDGNGDVDALTDGLLVLRYLFGFSGEALTGGAVGSNCGRCSAEDIVTYLDQLAAGS